MNTEQDQRPAANSSATEKPPKPYTLYLLECKGGSFYAGIAVDVNKRFAQHLAGKGAAYTRARPPIKILAQRQFPDRSSALKAEYAVKQLPKGRKIGFLRSTKV
jgi:putative endonuclease